MRKFRLYILVLFVVAFLVVGGPILRSQVGCGSCTGYCSTDWDCIDCGPQSTCGSMFCTNYTPLVIDVEGDGYEMTSTRDGVTFDMFGKSKPVRLSWTAAGADDAWLALDRNGDGRIDDGTELFGMQTPAPGLSPPIGNGFVALGAYDLPMNGGNGDGMIDWRDAIYANLLLWTDRDHDGRSTPPELRTLNSVGLREISLKYQQSQYADRYGNTFRYRALVGADKESDLGRWVYDVILVVERESRTQARNTSRGPLSFFRSLLSAQLDGSTPSAENPKAAQ